MRSRRGLTLIEVMVSIGILLVMSAAVVESLRNAITFQNLLGDRDEVLRTARVAMERLGRDLQLAYLTPNRAAVERYQTVFVGTSDGLQDLSASGVEQDADGKITAADTYTVLSVESASALPDPAWLESELEAGRLGGIGELVFNYAAIRPDDPAMAPFWEMAARRDVPAFVHSGRGPGAGQGPRRHPGCCADYREDFGNPTLLRPVLARHPNLRVVLEHVGFEFMDETVALMMEFLDSIST